MKQSRIFFVALVCFLMHSVVSMADVNVISPSQLPAAAKSFVAKQFPNKKIVRAEKDMDGQTDYEVKLNGGVEIDFDAQGQWTKVDCGRKAVPSVLIPKAISEYVKKNYSKAIITKIDKEPYGYEIELSNRLDLKFDKNGSFIGRDD